MDDPEDARTVPEQMPGGIDENELISPAVRSARGALFTLAPNDCTDSAL